ncbi:inner membrane protein [Escherichia coli]|nr:inner membrane protein [Escherichia coli]
MLMRMMGIKTDIVVSGSLSKEELRTIVHESRSQISRRNQDMLLSVLDLEKMTVDDIMVPRSEIIGIDINDDGNRFCANSPTHLTGDRALP